MTVPKYFDPTRRRVSVPPPVGVVPGPRAAPVPSAVYWDRSTSRRPSPFPTAGEILAAFEGLEPAALKTLEMLVALKDHTAAGESALDLFTRRVAWAPVCRCRAVAGGEYGHKAGCREEAAQAVTEKRLRFAGYLRRRRERASGGAPEVERRGALSFPFSLGVTD